MLINNILIIIQRSNGDVFLSASLISQLKENFHPCKIDLLVNDDTLPIAETLHHINKIFTFSRADIEIAGHPHLGEDISCKKSCSKNLLLSFKK